MPALQEALQLADRDGFGVEQEGLADMSAVLEAHDLDRARRGGVTHKTAFEWCHRVFATVSSYQDRIVLRNRVWNDEVYVNDTDLSKGYGQARKRGLSKQKLCIAIAIDASKNPVAVVCGHGKPSTKRIKEALGAHFAEGSTVVHDKERAHNGVIADRKCSSEAYKADVTDPAYLDTMEMINNLSSWLKRYLWRFTSMDPANLQSCLDWFVCLFRAHQAEDRWPKTARVVRHLMMTDAHHRSIGRWQYQPFAKPLEPLKN